MPNRSVYVGDTSPDARWQLNDKEGVITTLPDAESIDVFFIGQHFQFDGPGYAIDPPAVDGTDTWNVGYAFAEDDTSEADVYRILIVVTLESGDPDQVETFDMPDDSFTVKARPVTS